MSSDSVNADVMICPNCMAELRPEAHFCPSCNMPLSSIATMDPIKQIYAQGWFYHHAATSRISWLGLVGFWLIVRENGDGRSRLFVLSWVAASFFSLFWFFQTR